ncbi:hypothetical protein CHGG_09896 [Chaetomium globosum CBS 148.51]|uniref:Uncharacterized protein n=1 Tax=Chaetomium globosum (strain ATCC 6205 / CBS 148.51 / DSM 1962 / NBRC 6347 / NRRL 1970) TaxID=306901 RepID=Q2GQ58_CHAGB|nr:uncharacterized protein CHGG_09896 [Chaetomium globosum CBS 148.51]EAQ83492.1 hypothetical protein CHGG_09896 [Chaetomium globosum CBS 148.51]
MPHHTPPATCLSNRPHDNRVSDAAVHFNGCLPTSRLGRFYESLSPESQQRIVRINEKIASLRDRLETTERDSTAGARLRDCKRAMAQWRAATGRPSPSYTATSKPGPASRSETPGTPAFGGANHPADIHTKASVMSFKNGQPCDVPGLAKTFPNQKISMADLLCEDETRNPIMKPAQDGAVRYFHLPANNMAWVEEVIARYYHEKRPEAGGLFHQYGSRGPESKTERVLQPGYWRGQQNFDADSEVHARHMRPFCSGISVDSVSSEPNPRNMVLFMPYLHWETDRGRVRSAEITKEAGKHNLSSIADVIKEAKHQLSHTEAGDTVAPPTWAPQPSPPAFGNVDKRMTLGQALRAAAALLEAMDSHMEEQLTMRYLYAEPPMHPRRTLDQAYYGALRSTGTRDRDQVVYRGTTPQPHDCIGMDACPQCNEDIRKTPRLLMVDQLWLWILDENTVVTSFPRRWSRNRPDPSAIHKSLRMRLRNARHGEISSAYDLALVIVDETSRVFFDRTKTNTKQPNLVELFNAAIRDLTYKQTAAFDQFLIYTHLASRDYKRQRHVTTDNSSQNHLLNINPEGELLKEVKDIMDEIHIMMRIKEQQQSVMESFVKHIRRVLTPLARSHRPTAPTGLVPWDVTRGPTLEPNSPYADEVAHFREEDQRQNAKRTLTKADMLLQDVDERIAELRALLQNARNTSVALKDLLTLKQQQAGVIEAREAVKQAQLTLKQGQSIMIFTIVTIIFLPLSFCASLFGMSATEFSTDAILPLATELRLMFPISAGIILASFLFAFSSSVFANSAVVLARSAVSFVWNTAVTWVVVKTGLYVVGREMLVKANRLREREGTVTGAMKAEVLRREKNMERMRAAGHVRALARQKGGAGGAARGGRMSGDGEGGEPVMSPFCEGIPGSPSPFLGGLGEGVVDVELGERVSRKPSSQVHLVSGR